MSDLVPIIGWVSPQVTFAVVAVLAAVFLAASGVHSKRLTFSAPALELIGPLLLLNALFVTPLIPFSTFVMTRAVVLLLLLEAFLMLASSLAVWRLYSAGSAGATLLAQCLAPVFAVVMTMFLLPQLFAARSAAAAVIVITAVVVPLRRAFSFLSERSTVLLMLVASVTGGTLAVTTRMLGDLGLGVAPNFMLRNAVAGLAALVIVPPVSIGRDLVPALLKRTAYTVPYWIMFLTAVRLGSPAVAQTLLATAPLMVLRYESLRQRTPMPRSLLFSSLVVIVMVPVLVLS
jgi:drug/metabolite transporter (DMT)-like permease